MADDIELPAPDAILHEDGYYTIHDREKRLGWREPVFTAATVRGILAASRQATVDACNETGRVFREMKEWRQRAEKAEAALAAVVAAERERCANLCEAARPAGGRAWSAEQTACFEALSHVAGAIRALRTCVAAGIIPRGEDEGYAADAAERAAVLLREQAAELERLRAEAAWVPVSERVPEMGATVLIHLAHHEREPVKAAWRARAYPGATDWYWSVAGGLIASRDQVKHWRPLPASPDTPQPPADGKVRVLPPHDECPLWPPEGAR